MSTASDELQRSLKNEPDVTTRSHESHSDNTLALLDALASLLSGLNIEMADSSDFSLVSSLPKIDLDEYEEKYVVKADLPGIKKDNINISVDNTGSSLLLASGGKIEHKPEFTPGQEGQGKSDAPTSPAADDQASGKNVKPETNFKRILSERTFKNKNPVFARRIFFRSPVDGPNVKAELVDGVLTVHLPKNKEKSIAVSID